MANSTHSRYGARSAPWLLDGAVAAGVLAVAVLAAFMWWRRVRRRLRSPLN